MRALTLLVLASFLSTGCFSYVAAPAPLGNPEQGTPLRVYVSSPQDVKLAEITANAVTRIDGEIISVDPDQMALSAWWLTSASGAEFRGQGETVIVPLAEVERVERKRLSLFRTGALVAMAALAGAAFAGIEGGSTGGKGGSGGSVGK